MDERDVPAQVKPAAIALEGAAETSHLIGTLHHGDACPVAGRSERSRQARWAPTKHHDVAAFRHIRHGAFSRDELQAATGPDVTILAHVPRPSVPAICAAGLAVLLATAGTASASTGTGIASSGARWTVLVIAAVLIAAGGLAIVRTMWGMRAPLKPGATEGTETMWLLLPLVGAIALVVWIAVGIS